MGRLILDSDALIAIFKVSDKHHETIVKRLLHRNDKMVISTVALSESLVHAYRMGMGQAGRQQIREMAIETVDVDEEIAVTAAQLRATNNLKLGDALIAATAILHSCTLLTFDQKLARATMGAELLVS